MLIEKVAFQLLEAPNVVYHKLKKEHVAFRGSGNKQADVLDFI